MQTPLRNQCMLDSNKHEHSWLWQVMPVLGAVSSNIRNTVSVSLTTRLQILWYLHQMS